MFKFTSHTASRGLRLADSHLRECEAMKDALFVLDDVGVKSVMKKAGDNSVEALVGADGSHADRADVDCDDADADPGDDANADVDDADVNDADADDADADGGDVDADADDNAQYEEEVVRWIGNWDIDEVLASGAPKVAHRCHHVNRSTTRKKGDVRVINAALLCGLHCVRVREGAGAVSRR